MIFSFFSQYYLVNLQIMVKNKVYAMAKPFIKWAGGKGQLLSQLDDFLPARITNEDFTYIEPFVGGGAMLFHMLKKFPNLKRVVINDINDNLVKAYLTIKNNPIALIEILSQMEKEFLSINAEEERKSKYLENREKFNRHSSNDLDNTAYLIFLNKTCFNGLYRENSKGEFNVPFGKYKNPQICNANTILADSMVLNSREFVIVHGDYSGTKKFIDHDGLTFFYFDPPYRPLSATSSFTSYTKGDFNDNEQQRLAEFCKEISCDNCLWMLSNSDCSAKNPEDRFFEDLYNDFSINRVYASRSINANPSKRGKLTELLIHNSYEINKRVLFEAV